MKKISSSLFSNFFENNIEGIWVIDAHNKTTFVNPVTANLLGYHQEDFIGKEIPDFLEDEQSLIMEKKLDDRKKGASEYHELKFLKKDASPIWVSAACSPLYNENGDYVGAVGVMTEITDRKKNETILEAQKNVFETLVRGGNLENALIHLLQPIESLVKGVYPSILLLDESGERLLKGVSIGLPEEYNKSIDGAMIGLHAGACGTSAYTKEVVISSDIQTDPNWVDYKTLAEQFHLRACWSSPIISYEGKVLGTFAMYFRDKKVPTKFELELVKDVSVAAALCIEHIRLHEQEIKNIARMDLLSEARLLLSGSIEYEDVLNKIPDLLVRKGWADWSFLCLEGEDGIFRPKSIASIPELELEVKPLENIEMDLTKNFGLSRALKNNLAYFEHFNEEKLGSFLEKSGSDVPSPFLAKLLIKLQLRTFLVVPLSIRQKVFGGLILSSQDPKRKYNQSDLDLMKEISTSCSMAIDNALLYRETKKSVQAREDFISVASHELRTPITSIKMRIDLLTLMIEKGKFSQEVMDVLLPIVSELQPDIKNFTKLIETLLDISKIGVERILLAREGCDISGIIREEALRQKAIFDNNNTELILDIQPGIHGVCDHIRIQQVITNLLSNAMKFGNKKPVLLTVRADELNIRISVKDKGIGISREDAARIFKPFERAVSDQYFGGLGLGLYITERIVESHSGHIRVESAPGQGTTFIVELPLFTKS